ncbi:MFS transporter [Evansella tamaricis]|uniref:MFS transporter n=1 Tax=Evansella tamaricis TaxID=2069301 RepID=A0ABS6JE70_9BACI|nr:MFS transporter [Evansella tamaricis]
MNRQSQYQNNVIKLFLICVCHSFVLAYVIERIFALERGLTILEMQYILIIYSVTCLVLEVPFGILADKWRKKYVLALGIFFCCFEFLISIYAYDLLVFSIAFLLAAVGGSLKSGTVDSILYQSLKKTSQEKEYEKLKGYLTFTKYIVSGIAGIIGGIVAHQYELETTYWLSLVGLSLAAVISLNLFEPKETSIDLEMKKTSKVREVDSPPPSKGKEVMFHLRMSLEVIKGNPSLIQVIGYGSITAAVLYGQLHEMSSIIYLEIGVPITHFGFISFAITLFGGLAGAMAYKVKIHFGYGRTFGGILLISILAIYFYSLATEPWHIIFLVISIFVMEMVTPLTSGYIHRQIGDTYRVTISSLDAFAKNAVTIMISLLFGFTAEQWDIYVAFKWMSILLCLYGMLIIVSTLVRKVLKS